MRALTASILLAMVPLGAQAASSTITVNCAAGAAACDATIAPPSTTPVTTTISVQGGDSGGGQPPGLVDSGPITISGQIGQTIKGKHIHSSSGACVTITNSSNITLTGNEIGPCGTDKSDAESNGVTVDAKSRDIHIYDNYIHVDNQVNNCTKTHVGVTVPNGLAGPIDIKGNVIAYSERGVWLFKTSNAVVDGNFFLNLRKSATCSGGTPNQFPHGVQVWSDSGTIMTGVSLTNNYLLATAAGASVNGSMVLFPGAASDSFSVSYTTNALVSGNYVDLTGAAGSGNVQNSACGAIADIGNNGETLSNNIVSNGFHCGVAMAGGNNVTISGNKVLTLKPTSNSAAAIQLYASGSQCNGVKVNNNTAWEQRSSDGYNQAFYSDGACSNVTFSGNTGGNNLGSGCNNTSCPAYVALYPMATTNPPPKIPPGPKACLAPSPYSNNPAASPCSP